MKLIEVVIITGVQCISPVENTPEKTEVGKVWCAVVVEKDTLADRIVVTPETLAFSPEVRKVLDRIEAQAGTAPKTVPATIVPTSAAPEERQAMPVPDTPSPDERIEPAARIDVAVSTPPPENDDPPAAEAELPQPEVVASLEEPTVEEPPAAKAKPKKKKAASVTKKKRSDVCGRGRKAVWYTNVEGRRKYRCRPAGSAVNLY